MLVTNFVVPCYKTEYEQKAKGKRMEQSVRFVLRSVLFICKLRIRIVMFPDKPDIEVQIEVPCGRSACFKHKKPTELAIVWATPIFPAVVYTCRHACICNDSLSTSSCF